MKPTIIEYLPFYIGCEVQHTDDYYQVTITKLSYFLAERWNENMKLILRPLESMTEEERKKIEATKVFQAATPVHVVGLMVATADTFKLMCELGFDIFNLHPKGLCLYKNEKGELY